MAGILSSSTVVISRLSGLTTALALTKFAPAGKIPKIQIFEIRPTPATIGGAVNLTPNALRLLDHLGALEKIREKDYGRTIDYLEVFDVYSGRLAKSDFSGSEGKGIGDPPYKALRITRGDSLKGVLAAVEEHENITMVLGLDGTRMLAAASWRECPVKQLRLYPEYRVTKDFFICLWCHTRKYSTQQNAAVSSPV